MGIQLDFIARPEGAEDYLAITDERQPSYMSPDLRGVMLGLGEVYQHQECRRARSELENGMKPDSLLVKVWPSAKIPTDMRKTINGDAPMRPAARAKPIPAPIIVMVKNGISSPTAQRTHQPSKPARHPILALRKHSLAIHCESPMDSRNLPGQDRSGSSWPRQCLDRPNTPFALSGNKCPHHSPPVSQLLHIPPRRVLGQRASKVPTSLDRLLSPQGVHFFRRLLSVPSARTR